MSRPPLQKPTTYDIDQEQLRHDDAIHWFGEMACFLMFWGIKDYENGAVGRCTRCYEAGVWDDIADAYSQPIQHKCPVCFGTTFEGGLRAKLYRPAIWTPQPISDEIKKRGVEETIKANLDTISNIDLRDGDAIVRADGTRWVMDQPVWQEITTGFGSQGPTTSRLQGRASVVLQNDESSAAYMPAVTLSALTLDGWLPWVPHSPHPLDELGPDPVLQPEEGSIESGLLVQRDREFSITLRFFTDNTRTTLKDVSAETYVSEFRVTSSANSTVINTLTVDMTDAASGEVRVWLSDDDTINIVQNVVYWDVYRVEGPENVTVISPRRLSVV